MNSKSFYDRLRVKALLDTYLEGFIEYVKQLEECYSLTNEETIGVTKMALSKLSSLSAMWKKVTPTAAGYSQVADGDYIGDLKEMKMTESKATKRLQVESSFSIMDDGEFEGKTVKRFDGLDNETSMGFFKGYCEVIGFEFPDDLDQMQEYMDAFIANPERVDLYNLTLKSTTGKDGKTYSNLYVNGISEYTKGGEEVTEGEGESEGEVVEEGGEVVEEVEGESEVVEEVVEEVQEIAPPLKRFARVVTKPVAAQPVKVAAKPAAKPVAQVRTVVQTKVAAKPAPTGGIRKIVAKR